MLSKQPLPSFNSNLDTQFLQQNAEELDSIELFAELSEGFTIAFMEVNSDRDRSVVIEYLKNSNRSPDVQWIPLALADEDLRYFGLEVQERLEAVELIPNLKPVLLISGLERSIGVSGEYPEVLSNINMERDSYPRILPYPIVLLLPSYAITRCARFAPDFWSWKSIEVRLHSRTITISPDSGSIRYAVPEQFIVMAENNIYTESGFDFLNQLLVENPEPNIDRARLLNQLGDAYCSIYKNDEAEASYRSALDIYNNFPASLDQANTYDGLAKLCNLQGKYTAALQLWQQALETQQEIGDRQGEAASLHQLSMIYYILGDDPKALAFSQQSIKIQKEIGDQRGESTSLHQLSIIYETLGDYSQALTFSQQSIKIQKEIGDQRGEAASLHQLSMIYYNLGDYPQALTFSQQSIEIQKEIGDRQGESTSLHQLSIIYETLGDYSQALTFSQQSIEILKEIGDQSATKIVLHQFFRIKQAMQS